MKEHPIYKEYFATDDGLAIGKKGFPLKRHDTKGKYQVKVGNHFVLLNRFVWECYFGKIPTDHIIYYKDEDYKNTKPNNLGIRTKSEHQKIVMKKRWSSKE